MPTSLHAVILGGGVFGLTGALELRARGWRVSVLEAGRIPHQDAASTDISKVVRMDYGNDPQYTEMGEISLEGWRRWNRDWGVELYHEDGFLVMSRSTMKAGSFEQRSYDYLRGRGHALKRMDASLLGQKHPAWNAGRYVDGYLNSQGGWVESGRVVAALKERAASEGVVIREQVALKGWDDKVLPRADVTIAALGAWTPEWLPWLQSVMWATAQPVFHFRPADPAAFRAPEFPVWAADIGTTGWYGFPANAEGVVKVANPTFADIGANR